MFTLCEEEHFLHQLHVHSRGQNQTTHLWEEPTVPILLPLIARRELFVDTRVTNLVEHTWPTYPQSQNNTSLKATKRICIQLAFSASERAQTRYHYLVVGFNQSTEHTISVMANANLFQYCEIAIKFHSLFSADFTLIKCVGFSYHNCKPHI